jgi:hypothetical protein
MYKKKDKGERKKKKGKSYGEEMRMKQKNGRWN